MPSKRKRPFDSQAFFAKIREGRSVTSFAKGRTVFSQGEKGDAVYYIRKGKMKVSVVSEQGKEAVVSLLTAGDFFGEGCLAGQSLRISTVVATTESVVIRLEKAAMLRLLHDEPEFSEMFMVHVLGRSIRVEADLIDHLFNSSEKRLARLLLLMANYGKDATPEAIIAKVSQEMLAEMIGTTRSRVSFFMNKFRDLGFIDYNGQIKVHSSLLNVVLHDQAKNRN